MSENRTQNTWLISFADLLSLILTFFVMIYAMRELPEKKWRDFNAEISSSIQGKAGSWMLNINKNKSKTFENKEVKKNFTQNYIYNSLRNILMDSGFDLSKKEIEVYKDNGDVILSFNSKDNLLRFFNGENQDISTGYGKLIDGLQVFFTSNKNQLVILNESASKINEKLTNLIIGKLFEYGYEYRILKRVEQNIFQKDKLSIVIKSYEAFD